MYFFVQIERALLREGLEADGALERPLACRVRRPTGDGGTEKQNKTTMDHHLLTEPGGVYLPTLICPSTQAYYHHLTQIISQRTHALTVCE